MSDSIDRVFVHALNTVKKIPRVGSSRPPHADRLKLYGLYKQSMEGDVEGVMERPIGSTPESFSEQEKWDAWDHQKGLSRTEAKRHYISTLIETMHQYASNTPEARELVMELEFVWDQIKSNPPSSSSAASSYPLYQGQERNGTSSSGDGPPIYPVMSAKGSRHPRTQPPPIDSKNLRVMSPMSQSQTDAEPGQDPLDADEREEFVDAQDSHYAGENAASPTDQAAEDPADKASRGIIAAIKSKAMGSGSAGAGPGTRGSRIKPADMTKWHRRIESALVKITAEMAALREQLEMQQQSNYAGSVYSSIIPFPRRGRAGFVRWMLDSAVTLAGTVLRHIVVDALILAVVVLWMRQRGIPIERLERCIVGIVQRIQQLTFVRRLDKMRRQNVPSLRASRNG